MKKKTLRLMARPLDPETELNADQQEDHGVFMEVKLGQTHYPAIELLPVSHLRWYFEFTIVPGPDSIQ